MNNKWILFALLFCSLPLLAWGPKGHRIIAQVAYDHMTPRATKYVDAILGQHGLVYWAAWPDEIRSDTIYPDRYDWHYQDMPANLSDSAVWALWMSDLNAEGRMSTAVGDLQEELGKQRSNRDALIFLAHIMGDMFCPMHMAHVEDKGGNLVAMTWFGQPTNLHRVWDENLIESRGFSYTEFATMLTDTYGAETKDILNESWQDVVLGTYHMTSDIYAYQQHFDGNTYHYIWHWKTPLEHQLYRAGIWLARVLNEMYR